MFYDSSCTFDPSQISQACELIYARMHTASEYRCFESRLSSADTVNMSAILNTFVGASSTRFDNSPVEPRLISQTGGVGCNQAAPAALQTIGSTRCQWFCGFKAIRPIPERPIVNLLKKIGAECCLTPSAQRLPPSYGHCVTDRLTDFFVADSLLGKDWYMFSSRSCTSYCGRCAGLFQSRSMYAMIC